MPSCAVQSGALALDLLALARHAAAIGYLSTGDPGAFGGLPRLARHGLDVGLPLRGLVVPAGRIEGAVHVVLDPRHETLQRLGVVLGREVLEAPRIVGVVRGQPVEMAGQALPRTAQAGD